MNVYSVPIPEISRHSRSSASVPGAQHPRVEDVATARRRVLDANRDARRSASQNGAVVGVLTGIGRWNIALSWSIPLQDEGRLLGQDAAVAGDERPVAVGDLRGTGAAHDLAGGVADVVHAAGDAGLAETELAAGGVQREVAAERQVVLGDELPCPCPSRRSPRPRGSAAR